MPMINASHLESLIPLRELNQDDLIALAKEAEIEEFDARSLIFRLGSSDGWSRYVLSGTVVLVDADEQRRLITGTGDAGVAAEPLSHGVPFKTHALAATSVKLIRLPLQRVEEMLAACRLPDYGVNEVSADAEDPGEGLFYRLFEDLMSDKLELPSLPDIAVRVRAAVDEHDAGPSEIAKILQSDPVVAARVIQTANSARYAGQGPVDSIQPAISRLGIKITREVVTAVALRAVFGSKSPALTKRLSGLWLHSAHIAAICQVMATKLHGFDPGRGLLAGLVHDIGVIPMITNAVHYPTLLENPELLEQTIGHYRGQVGTMILRRWNFPEELAPVPLAAEEWLRETEGDLPDYCDLVVAAQLQAMSGTAQAADYPVLNQSPSYRRLHLAQAGIFSGETILEEAQLEIDEAQRMLVH